MLEDKNPMHEIDNIIRKTIEIVEKGQKDLFDITEHARQDLESIKKELERLKEQSLQIIQEVDRLTKEEKDARYRLLVVSKDFNRYSEEDIKEAYRRAESIKVALSRKEEEERWIREERNKLELRLKNTQRLVKKAESMVSHMGAVLDYLRASIKGIDGLAADIRKKQYVGYRVIKATEEERRRLAREIHDGPTQDIVNIGIGIELCLSMIDRDISKTKNLLRELKEQVNRNIQDLRKVIYNLRPMSLDDLGLTASIEKYLQDFQNSTGITTTFRLIGTPVEMNGLVQIALYRVVQEALTNVRKHSQASRVMVKIEFVEGYISLLVMDNGKGFDVEDAFKWESEEKSFGLINMRERVELLNGYMEVNSKKGKGTTIFMRIPLE